MLLLESLCENPSDFVMHFTRMAAHTAMKIAYGHKDVTDNQDLLSKAIRSMEIFTETVIPGAWLVDSLPILDHLPSWFPFAAFKRYQEMAKPIVVESVTKPFEIVKKHLAQGTADGSFTSYLLQSEKLDPETEDCIKWAANGIFFGQFETTTAALSWFTHAMVKHPDVQKKAQEEIDRVVGNERLPKVEDRDSLPYLNAVLREVMRWQPIVCLSTRAVSEESDEYHGYFVPAYTEIVVNIWAVLHDPTVYPDPERFIPERHLEKDVPDPLDVAFGIGRRGCPGRQVAQAQPFVTMACMLATLDLKPVKDEHGNELIPETKGGDLLINFPVPFKSAFTARSEMALELIHQSAEHARSLPDKLERWSD
ncbi:uncharacterized protein PHACADRAFT_208100 [Phanerochaete carnosa HHB-10118-sp]|uniref:Cytochrome P450 n=1 Tax=Phanerochaete carnosa (strain HHB-10118-sp) TaxID=650164 RepID=K5V2Z9_PHACS|nr:uncharacterized protein PHACADRAFT_208100 [Phanerochaete carnosa HHB-10118-sp]EKM56931.1 hypothetical protein PHACADRAFT_208100 [Phanerochaete carnosa HHB-10118-sp]